MLIFLQINNDIMYDLCYSIKTCWLKVKNARIERSKKSKFVYGNRRRLCCLRRFFIYEPKKHGIGLCAKCSF